MPPNPDLAVTITGLDKLSPVLERIGGVLEQLEKKLEHVRGPVEKLEEEGPWARLRERIHETGERVGELGEKFHGVAERIAEMIPPLAGLGALGAVGGVFELAASTAEWNEKLQNTSKTLGLTAEQLQKFQLVARMTGTDTDAMALGMSRLGINLAGAAMGTNKAAAGLFRALHIQVRNAKGGVRDFGDVLKDIMVAFERNPNPATRELMARTLFGRGGIDLIPMLTRTREQIDEIFKLFDRVKVTPDEEQQAGLETFLDAWKGIGASVDSVKRKVGIELAAALGPVVDRLKDMLIEHSDEIAKFTGEKMSALVASLQAIDWKATFKDVDEIAGVFGRILDSLGGIKGVLEVMTAITVLKWTSAFLSATNAILMGIAGIVAAITGADAALTGSLIYRIFGAAGLLLVLTGDTEGGATSKPATDEQQAEAQRAADAINRRTGGWGGFFKRLFGGGDGDSTPDASPPVILRSPLGDLANRIQGSIQSPAAPDIAVPSSPGLEKLRDIARNVPRIDLPDAFNWSLPPLLPDLAVPRAPLTAAPALAFPDLFGGGPGRDVRGQVDINLNIPNLPLGATVDSRASGVAGNVRVNVGQAFDGLYGTAP